MQLMTMFEAIMKKTTEGPELKKDEANPQMKY